MTSFLTYEHATWSDWAGCITRVDDKAGVCKNVWWKPFDGNHEVMFSLRNDGAWRAFPGPADGVPLKRKRG